MPEKISEILKKVIEKTNAPNKNEVTPSTSKKRVMVKKKETPSERIYEGEKTSVDDFNMRKQEVERIASNDSISSAKKAKFDGKDLVDQRRTGNEAANKTRVKLGNPQIQRGRSQEDTDGFGGGDKYHNPLDLGGWKTDSYSRNKPLEKDVPVEEIRAITNRIKSTKAFIKPSAKVAENKPADWEKLSVNYQSEGWKKHAADHMAKVEKKVIKSDKLYDAYKED